MDVTFLAVPVASLHFGDAFEEDTKIFHAVDVHVSVVLAG